MSTRTTWTPESESESGNERDHESGFSASSDCEHDKQKEPTEESEAAVAEKKKEEKKLEEVCNDERARLFIIFGLIAFLTFLGIREQILGIKLPCYESEANVCCDGFSQPLIIQGDKVKIGSKVFSPEEIERLKSHSYNNTDTTYSIFEMFDTATRNCELSWSKGYGPVAHGDQAWTGQYKDGKPWGQGSYGGVRDGFKKFVVSTMLDGKKHGFGKSRIINEQIALQISMTAQSITNSQKHETGH